MKRNTPKLGWLTAAITTMMVALAGCQAINYTPPPTSTVEVPTEAPAAAVPTVDPSTATPAPTPEPIVLEGATTTESGLQYLEVTPGKGEQPEAGNIITMQYVASLADGTELVNTYTQGKPVTTVWKADNLLPGWHEGIGLMNAGGKSKMVLPPELAFGVEGSGQIPPNAQIVIEMELLEVKPAPVPTEVKESELTKTDSGLQYYDITVGEGAEAKEKDTVSTDYTIWVKNDTGAEYVDQSTTNGPVQFVVGRGDSVFPGWDEGVAGMKVGGKRLLIIPAELAMGAQGGGPIPPNATLVMEIELKDVKEPQVATEVDEKDYTTTDSGLKFYDLKEGTGETPQQGQTVVVHYTGWLEDGTQFDSSLTSGQPFSFVLGAGNVIPGWDEGVATMKVGGKRQLVIPAELGYGENGAGGVIPPGATLIFEVELLEIQ